MKTVTALFSAIFILTVSVRAHSESVFVGKVRHVQRIPNGEAILEFGQNVYPNRAWVSATLCEKYVPGDWAASDCRPYNQYKFRVVGLIYDGYSGEIRLGRHVCAWVENGLLRPISRQTGQCGLMLIPLDVAHHSGMISPTVPI